MRVDSASNDHSRFVRTRHNLAEIATNAPERAEDATLDYSMSDYVDLLELHLRQILGADWSAEPRTRAR